VFVLSDHGFGSIHSYLNFNVWLMEHGYLSLSGKAATRLKKAAFSLGATPEFFYRQAMRLGFAKLRLSAGVGERAGLFNLVNRAFISLRDVDWPRTKVYAKGNYGQMFVNLAGREPSGAVPSRDYEAVLEALQNDLSRERTPGADTPLIGRFFRKEDLYNGPFTPEAPDLSFIMSDMSYKPMGTVDFTSNRFLAPVYGNSGDHRMEGFFGATGQGIKDRFDTDRAQILDMAPTLLCSMGLPVPEDLDGRVLTEIFTDQFLEAEPVRAGPPLGPAQRRDQHVSREEEEEVRARLKDMGYM